MPKTVSYALAFVTNSLSSAAISPTPRQVRATLCALCVSIASAGMLLSGCTGVSSADPQQQFVEAQKSSRAVYDKSLASYRTIAANPGIHSREQVLGAYQQLLYQYSNAAISWVRAIDPPARQALPPSVQPLSEPSGTPTLTDVNRAYERALQLNAAMWEIDQAAFWGRPSNTVVPKYTGITLFMPEAPPLPPLQDARDPAYARLVAMTKAVDAAQKADIGNERVALAKQQAEQAAWSAAHIDHRYDNIDTRTGLSYPAPQQVEQRWCYQNGGRFPC